MKFISLSCVFLFFISINSTAQHSQQMRGTVLDQVIQRPLAGATVTLTELNRSVITNESGEFRFPGLSIGTYRLQISYTGYKDIILDNIGVNSGKETVLNIAMETSVHTEEAVIVKANSKKNKPVNDMSVVSARAFTVEETQKYAAAVNDPLRMATAFPGVLAGDDGNNHIIIRGNSPTGLLWKMEGMDIPNPNHFSNMGSSGGGISILSAQLLANSDFVTAAFAPEYGNALSGVFDLRLRKGNNEKHEYTLQAGVLGLNAAMEGPFSKKYKGSYLINYRYSTLELLNKVGVLPGEASTNFQDLSYNIFLPTNKLGDFTLFGFGGLSNEVEKVDKDSSKWESRDDRYPSEYTANTMMTGLTHTLRFGDRMLIKSGIGRSFTKNASDESFMEDDFSLTKTYKDNYRTTKLSFNSMLSYKFSRRFNMRGGIMAQQIKFNYYNLSAEHEGDPLLERVNSAGTTSTQQAYIQGQFKPTDQITLNGGLHFLQLSLNNSTALEPRLSARFNLNSKTSIGLGFGLHSQLQAPALYFTKLEENGTVSYPNKNLGFTKARHYVVSATQRLSANLLVKAEVYYQQLFNVPVSLKPGSTFSALNIQDEYSEDPQANIGKGRNYGLEVSIERYLNNNFYLTLTNSLYQSKYTAADGKERNTRFNGNHISTLILGKDFVSSAKGKTFGVNVKTIYAGGLRTTPIDLAESIEKGYTVYDEENAFTLQNPDYFRTDLRVSMKWNRRRFTSTLSLDIQNLTNRLNVYNQDFDVDKGTIKFTHQTGLIPVLNYKIEF